MGTVQLRPINIDDTDNIVTWRNMPDVKKNLYSQDELTPEAHLNWLRTKVETGQCVQFIIEILDAGSVKPAGTVFIKNIDHKNSKGEFGIFIGEREARGKGYAAEATRMILRHAFAALHLNRVYLTVFSDNMAAIRAYEKAGFLVEGTLKQDFLRYDGYADIVCMGITRDVWKDDQDS
jgi:UDP-4-amino-4,6-dideoxy-N-acetyl-beta-L-altrosamine N-acetyltransferase